MSIRKAMIDFYLDWSNNFLTVSRLAEYYGITQEDALIYISKGRIYNEEDAHFKKQSQHSENAYEYCSPVWSD